MSSFQDFICAGRPCTRPGARSLLKPSSSPHLESLWFSFMKLFLSSIFSVGPSFLLLLLSSHLLLPCYAQTNKIFQWSFSNNAISESLPSCQTFPITVKPFDPANDTHGVPPFYMMAFAVGGTPITSLIGLNETSLAWTVEHPVDTQLMLSVVDSQGSAGGIPPRLYTVVTGQSTQCIKTNNQPDFTVSANVTDTVTTCQPWGLRIKGGVPPYNLTLAAINSPIVTNVTMGPKDDAFTYIDRADPNTQLLAAISDFTGRFATGTPIVKTQGSANVDCVGWVSSSGNSTKLQQEADAAAAAASNKKRTQIIVGVTVSLVGLLLLCGGLATLLYMRRKKMRQQTEFGTDMTPKPFDEPGGQVLSINAFMSPNSPPRTPKTPGSASDISSSVYTGMPSYDPYRQTRESTHTSNSNGMRPTSSSSSGRPGFTNFPSSSVRRSNKAMEAGLRTAVSVDSFPSQHAAGGSGNRSSADPSSLLPAGAGFPQRSTSLTANDALPSATTMTPDEEYVYQHRDGGRVRELPPPYADRGSQQPPES